MRGVPQRACKRPSIQNTDLPLEISRYTYSSCVHVIVSLVLVIVYHRQQKRRNEFSCFVVSMFRCFFQLMIDWHPSHEFQEISTKESRVEGCTVRTVQMNYIEIVIEWCIKYQPRQNTDQCCEAKSERVDERKTNKKRIPHPCGTQYPCMPCLLLVIQADTHK